MLLEFSTTGFVADGERYPFDSHVALTSDGSQHVQVTSIMPGYLVMVRQGKQLVARVGIPRHRIFALDNVEAVPLEPPVRFASDNFSSWHGDRSRIILHAQPEQTWRFFTTGDVATDVITDGQAEPISGAPLLAPGLPPNHQITGATYAVIVVKIGDRVTHRELHLGPGVNDARLKAIQLALVNTAHLTLPALRS